MKEKVLKTIGILEKEYNIGGYTRDEYIELLNGLNVTIYHMNKFLLCTDDEIDFGEMQELIHSKIDEA